MLASRLVKSCLFMLVALAPVAAKAGFIIDSFNGSFTNGALPSLPNGVTITRTVGFFVAPSTFTANGTSLTVNLNPGSVAFIEYKLGGASTFGDTGDLAGLSAARLDFLSASGSIDLNYSLDGGTELDFGSLTNTTNFSVASAIPGFASANVLTFFFQNSSGTQSRSFTIDRVVATPEPTTMLLFGAVVGTGFIVRRKKRQAVAN